MTFFCSYKVCKVIKFIKFIKLGGARWFVCGYVVGGKFVKLKVYKVIK